MSSMFSVKITASEIIISCSKNGHSTFSLPPISQKAENNIRSVLYHLIECSVKCFWNLSQRFTCKFMHLSHSFWEVFNFLCFTLDVGKTKWWCLFFVFSPAKSKREGINHSQICIYFVCTCLLSLCDRSINFLPTLIKIPQIDRSKKFTREN